MNPFMFDSSERLTAWSNFRDSLPENDEEEQIQKVAKYWAQCPFSKWSIHLQDSSNWPTVWEMLYDGDYCRNAIALGMEATLRWSGWDKKRLKLIMVRDVEEQEEFFVVQIDDTHYLNYSYGTPTKIEDVAHKVQELYSYSWGTKSYKKLESDHQK